MTMKKGYSTFFLVAIGLAFLLLAGCAKQAEVKEEAPMEKKVAAETQAPAQPSQTVEKGKVMTGQSAREKTVTGEPSAVKEEATQLSDIHFDYDRYNLRPDDRKILDMHAKWLTEHPKFFVRIEGNCDERGSIEYNIALGQKRADEAMRYLADLGIDKSKISTVSYGKERPLDPGHNEEAWAKNRRDHFVVTLNK